ncbi:MAG: ATP-binding protein [Anaerolineae bacterium]
MYSSFTARRFRCFRDMTVAPLAQINLISGKNNVGKTALIEALWMHHGYFNPELGIRLSVLRGLTRIKTLEAFHDLFADFDVAAPIEFVSQDERGITRTLRITISEQTRSRLEFVRDGLNGGNGYQESLADRTGQESTEASTARVDFEFTVGGGPAIRSQAFVEPNAIRFERAANVKEPTGIFLPAGQPAGLEEMAERFANLAVAKQEDQAVRFLRIVEPRLQRLAVQYRGGVPVIYGDVDLPRLIPLPLMGQGTGRLLQIALAIPEARGGILLIDELENGIHHAIMPAVWRGIAALARTYQVQIFATTHSRECIDAALEAFQDDLGVRFALHRLESANGDMRTMTYDLDMLRAAQEVDAEVR